MKKRKCIMKNMETGAEDKNQQTAIYVMTHKAFTPPPDPLYIPLHVGRAAASSYSRDEKSSPLSFCVGDNTGDHISEKNCYYSELTGMYWVWKNSHAKVVGTCHYRRYLLNEQGKLFTEAQILSLLQQYDVITTKELQSAYFRNMCAFAAPAAENPPHNPDKSPVSHGLFRPDIKSCGEKQIHHNKKNSAAVLSL